MKDLFIQLCNFSVVTSIAIVIAIALRPVLKKGPSFIRCALWTLVFLRLLIPVEFLDMPFSLPKVFETEQTLVAPKDEGIKEEIKEDVKEDVKEENNSVQQVPSPPVQPPIGGTLTETQRPVSKPVTDTPAIKEDAATENNGITGNDSITENGTVAESQTTTQAETKLDIVKLISVIWAVGAALMLGYMLISNLILRYKIRGAVVYDNNIRILDKDCSPFVFGFFRPDIYIPASINKRDWGYIIAHESSHIKRLDHIVKPLAFTALCLYWYNPFVWAAYILFSKDIEYACDERTVKTMGSEDKKAYSMALLSVSQSSGRIFAPLSFGEVNVKERIKRVMRFKNSIWAVSLAAVICISLLIFIACTPDGDNKGLSSDTENSSSVEISVDSSDESSNTEENQPLLLISYADDKDASVLPYYIEDQDGMLIKIKANKTITDFTYVSIDSSTTMDILFETEELTADTPLYIKIRKDSWAEGRGVLYEDDTDKTVLARIVHNNTDGVDSLSFEIIPHGNSFKMVDNDYFVVYVPDLTTQGPDGFNYITHMIDGEVDAETIVNHCIEEGLFPEGSAMQSFEIKDRVGYLDMNAMCYSLSTEYHEYIGLKAIEKTFLENYKTRIDKFVITYDGEERSNGSTGGETSEVTEPLKIQVDYVSSEDTGITPTFVDEGMNIEYIKIWVNKPVTEFKFISVLYDPSTTQPYAGETLSSLEELTPEKPFYAASYVWEAASSRGISYKDENGATICCRINYNSAGSDFIDSSLYLDDISPDSPSAVISTAKSFLTALNAGDEAGYKACITEEFAEGFKHKIYDSAVDFSSFYGKLKVDSLKNLKKAGYTKAMRDYPEYYYTEYKHYTPYTATLEYLNDSGVYEEKIFKFIIVAASDGGYVIGDFRLSAAEIEYPYNSELAWHDNLKPFLTDEEIEKACRTAVDYIVALSMGDEAKARSLGNYKEDWFLGKVSTDFGYGDYNADLYSVRIEDRKTILLRVGFDYFSEGHINGEPYLGYFLEKQIMQISVYDNGSCYVDYMAIEE